MISLIVRELHFTLEISLKHFSVAGNAADTVAHAQGGGLLGAADSRATRGLRQSDGVCLTTVMELSDIKGRS
jgi:hypothetical protein